MRRDHRDAWMGLLLIAVAPAGCELALGDLPRAREDLTTSGTGQGGSASQGGSTTQGGNGGSSGMTTSSGGSTSTGGTSSTGMSTVASGSGGCCDCDGDKHLAEGPPCGGDDCDDNDPLTYPGEPTYYGVPNKKGNFDYDCSKKDDPDPDLYKTVDCGLLKMLPCNKSQGFLGAATPACGGKGTWGTCQGAILPCNDQPLEVGKTMTCK